ncbi:hypothetical protein [Micromonospora sonchi]|nr:hypothetical protein [Micromonospora sonchi]
MDDIDLHHLLDLIRDDRIRFTNWRHTDIAGNDIDDLVYAAEDGGHITVYPGGVLKPTRKGQEWRASNHRPGPAVNIVFQDSAVS